MSQIITIDNIGLLHEMLQQGKPKHPLMSIVDFSKVNFQEAKALQSAKFTTSFYSILLKELHTGSIKYGRQYYDFQEGSLFFYVSQSGFCARNHRMYLWLGVIFSP